MILRSFCSAHDGNNGPPATSSAKRAGSTDSASQSAATSATPSIRRPIQALNTKFIAYLAEPVDLGRDRLEEALCFRARALAISGSQDDEFAFFRRTAAARHRCVDEHDVGTRYGE